jgi:hypothetical protein
LGVTQLIFKRGKRRRISWQTVPVETVSPGVPNESHTVSFPPTAFNQPKRGKINREKCQENWLSAIGGGV